LRNVTDILRNENVHSVISIRDRSFSVYAYRCNKTPHRIAPYCTGAENDRLWPQI